MKPPPPRRRHTRGHSQHRRRWWRLLRPGSVSWELTQKRRRLSSFGRSTAFGCLSPTSGRSSRSVTRWRFRARRFRRSVHRSAGRSAQQGQGRPSAERRPEAAATDSGQPPIVCSPGSRPGGIGGADRLRVRRSEGSGTAARPGNYRAVLRTKTESTTEPTTTSDLVRVSSSRTGTAVNAGTKPTSGGVTPVDPNRSPWRQRRVQSPRAGGAAPRLPQRQPRADDHDARRTAAR